jgi:hypothetical protein
MEVLRYRDGVPRVGDRARECQACQEPQDGEFISPASLSARMLSLRTRLARQMHARHTTRREAYCQSSLSALLTHSFC